MRINTDHLVHGENMTLAFQVDFDGALVVYKVTYEALADMDPAFKDAAHEDQFQKNLGRIEAIIEQRRASGDTNTLITTADI